MCTLVLILGQAERRAVAVIRQAAWAFLLAGIALLGVVLLTCGLATFLESRIGLPGAGLMAIGGAILALVLVFALVRAGRKPK